MSRVYSCMEDVACRTRTVTTVCSHISRKRHPSSLPYLLWMTGVHRLYQVARVLAALWTFLLLWLRKLLCVMLGRSQKSLRKLVQHQPVKYHRIPVSPLNERRLVVVKRKTLVLDLDETLIHAQRDGIPEIAVTGKMADFLVKVTIDDCPVQFHVFKRPHVDFFLKMVNQWYDLVVFTASLEVYGTAVVSRLDRRRKMLTRCFFRQHCTMDLNGYTKDLTLVSPDLSKVLILDNSPGAYRSNPDNAVPIKSWFSDPHDTALLNLLPVLDALRFTTDVRSVLRRNLHLHCMH